MTQNTPKLPRPSPQDLATLTWLQLKNKYPHLYLSGQPSSPPNPPPWILTQEQAQATREDRVMNAMVRALEIQRQTQKMPATLMLEKQMQAILVAIPFLLLSIHLLSLLLR